MNNLENVDKEQLKIELRKRLNSLSFYDFFIWASKLIEPTAKWDYNWHHKYICDILQKEAIRIKNGEKRNKHIIINVPFRSSKSMIVSIVFPVWNFIINEGIGIINLSYSDTLATDHSNKVVALLNNPEFKKHYPDLEFEENQSSKTNFKLKNGSYRQSAGMVGSVLGRGGNIVIMDDPNNVRRLSQVERHNTIEAWRNTVSTRLNDPEIDLFIVIQQRLHTGDLTGYLLENDADNWMQIKIPAEITDKIKPEPLYLSEFYKDYLFWKRFNREVLNNFKKVLGTVGYANQLEQEATAIEGNIVKKDWINIIPLEQILDLKLKWEMIIDTAQTAKKSNDPSGIIVFAKHGNSIYIRKAIEKRYEFPELLKLIAKIYKDYNCKKIWIEPKSSGLDVFNTLKYQTTLHIGKLPAPTDDKETRLNAASPYIEDGRLYMVEDSSNTIVIDELTGFPNAAHDEFVDLVAYAINNFLKSNRKLNYATG